MENKNLGGMMNSELVDAFTQQVEERGYRKKRALAGAVMLWLSLPSDAQAKILHQQSPEEAYSVVLGKVLEQLTNLDGKLSEKHNENTEPQKKAIAFHESTKKLLKMRTKDYTVAIKLLSKEEQTMLNKLRSALSPDDIDTNAQNLG